MKEYTEAKATFISFETSDVITASGIENRGVLNGFGDITSTVSIDDLM